MIGEHDWGGLVEGNGDESACPSRAGGDGVGSIGYDGTGEAFEGFVEEGEGDGGGICGDDGPVSLVVADDAAVESIFSFILVFWNVRCDTVDGEGAIFDSIGVSTDYWAEIGVICFRVCKVLGAIVIA